MSDHEEPEAKLAKLEARMEEIDDGQEEWLSEGILTDDDYHPAVDHDSSAIQSQDETMEQEDSTDIFTLLKTSDPKPNDTELNTDQIEEALDNMEKTDENEDDLPGDLSTFLVRKQDGKIIETRDDSMDSVRHSDEDANDTDELLRMLGDDDQKSKKKKEVRMIVDQKKSKDQQSTDEEDLFERLKNTTPRVKAKRVVLKKATKVVPEVTSDEETSTKMKSRTKTPKKTIVKKVATKALSEDLSEEELRNIKVTRTRVAKQATVKRIPTRAVPEDMSDDDNVSSDDRVMVKKIFNVKRKVHFAAKSTAKSSVTAKMKKISIETGSSKSKAQQRTPRAQKQKSVQVKELEELINEEEFLEDDAFDMNEFREDMKMEGENRERRQIIMRPERMDEEHPTDGESGTDDNSLYEELPSTDSEEDMEEWFTLDIRSERAGDYLPLLGSKAHEVLLDEKKRISGRMASLRENLTAIADGSRAQAEQLRRASLVIAELDAAIKAA